MAKFSNLFIQGKEIPKVPKYKNDEELNVKVVYNLLEKEISIVKIIIALLDKIKHKRDFNIHSTFHAMKYYVCITGDILFSNFFFFIYWR